MCSEEGTERLRQLVQAAKTKGYVLYDEVDELLPAGYQGGIELDDILSELAKNSIEVLEEPRGELDVNLNESSREGELRELAAKVVDENAPLRMYLLQVLELLPLTREHEKELAKRVRGSEPNAEDAEKQLIEANLGLVVMTAKRYQGRGLGLLDLGQEGNIGLMKAARDFDYMREYRFSTYAIWWIRRAIRSSLP